jgi:ABC-2 type transport system ATP-binding protein
MHEINAYPNSFTGKRLLEHVAQFYNISLSDQSVDKLLRDVGLAEARDKPIKAYSAGMTRRLGLAQALIGNPELVILDEPTANIDPLGRITLLDKIKEMHKAYGTSFFISTHILSDLEKVCSWLSIIDSGKIVDQGKINDLAGRYSANIYKIDVSMPELFLEKIKKLACVENSRVEGDKVFCRVRDLESFCLEAPRIITENKLLLRSFQQSSGTLEEIYAKTAKRSQ